MGFIDSSDVKKLLQDPEFKSDIAKAMIGDPGAMEDLAEDVADEMEDELENDDEFKSKVPGDGNGQP